MPKLEKEEKQKISDLSFHLKMFGKEKIRPKERIRQEIRAEINEKINKPLARLLKEKKRKAQTMKV